MALQLIKIETVEVASPVTSVTFSSIPQGYTDLKLVMSGRTSRASTYDFYKIKFNGSATTYSERSLNGNGSVAASEVNNATTYAFNYIVNASTSTSSTFGNAEMYIPNYTGSNYKSYSTDAVNENNATVAFAAFTAGLWSTTSAITSISIESANSANFDTNSTFTLYGVL